MDEWELRIWVLEQLKETILQRNSKYDLKLVIQDKKIIVYQKKAEFWLEDIDKARKFMHEYTEEPAIIKT